MSWNYTKEWARFFYVSGKRKTKLVARKKDDKKKPQTNPNQPTNYNSTNQNQIKPTTSSFPNRATWKLFSVIFRQMLPQPWLMHNVFAVSFSSTGLPSKGSWGRPPVTMLVENTTQTLENWRNVTWNWRNVTWTKGNHFRRIGIFYLSDPHFSGRCSWGFRGSDMENW